MKKKGIVLLLSLLLLFSLFSVGVSAEEFELFSEDSSGVLNYDTSFRISSDNIDVVPMGSNGIAISTASELSNFRNRVNNGETELNAYLTGDINLNNIQWVPIGSMANPYSGTFDGNGYSILGLNVSSEIAGLFGCTNGAVIKGVGTFGTVEGESSAGGILGIGTDTYIIECYNYCDISAGTIAGGIVGSILSSYEYGDEATVNNTSIISSCFNVGDISGSYYGNTGFVGGIVGLFSNYTTLYYCYNWGDINCPDGASGGISGTIGEFGVIANVYNVGLAKTVDSYGEIVGMATDDGAVANSYYISNGYDGIGVDKSSYSHKMYYTDNYDTLREAGFVEKLNNGDSEFIFDRYVINDGFPILYWELMPVEGVYLDKTSVELNIGESLTLKETVYPFNAYTWDVAWKSSNSSVATVVDGKITAKGAGVANITVTTIDGGYSAVCKVTVKGNDVVTPTPTPTPTPIPDPTPVPLKNFSDVPSDAYYAAPVSWAVANSITTGTTDTTFSPDSACTRAQAVTFLWRAAGSPEPQSSYNPFADVKAGQYYTKAVLWAVENGITNGTSASAFSPDATCTRGQIVTFLYRFEGSPSVSVRNTFADVPSNAYYAKAVTWAVDNEVTNGTGANTFSPDSNCTRAQIVTFLYRASN